MEGCASSCEFESRLPFSFFKTQVLGVGFKIIWMMMPKSHGAYPLLDWFQSVLSLQPTGPKNGQKWAQIGLTGRGVQRVKILMDEENSQKCPMVVRDQLQVTSVSSERIDEVFWVPKVFMDKGNREDSAVIVRALYVPFWSYLSPSKCSIVGRV